VPCYITVQDRDLRLLKYNREFTRHFSPEPLRHCFEVYKGRSERCDPCPVAMTFEDGECHSSEETGISRNGFISHWMVRTSPIRDVRGNIAAVMETSLDITQMKRLEEEIRKSEEKYRDIFNHIPNAVFVLDRTDLSILDSNDSVLGIYGYEKEDIVGTPFMDLFDPVDRTQCETEIRTSFTLTQTRQIRKDSRTIFVNICISPSEYLGREALLLTAIDVTERLMAEQQLIQASKMSTLGEMATGIAHELNQPLSVIKTASGFLMRKVRKGEAIPQDILETMASEIDSHVDRASRIINHLREFGRKSEVKKEKVDVNEALRQAVEIFSQQLKLRGIEVVRDLQESLPLIWGDLNRLEQVFINLLINARDAIEEKMEKHFGSLILEKKILLRTNSADGKVIAEVRDTGTGIPESAMDRIFEPFFTTKQVGKGTGLGLSISYGIVQDYEGTIRVETRGNEGAGFIVEFPVCGEDS
jgi:histidine kinase